MTSYTYPKYPYVPPEELVLKPGGVQTVPVLVVGAGPVGLTLALDLALKGIPVTVLDEDDTVSIGSRSICQAQRTLEIWHRLGVADRMVAKGVTWDQGEVLLGDQPLYRFNLQPEPGHRFPAFINLQQYYCEQYLVERCREEDKVDLRFLSKVVGVRPDDEHVGSISRRRRDLPAARVAGGLRRRAQPGAHHARPATRARCSTISS